MRRLTKSLLAVGALTFALAGCGDPAAPAPSAPPAAPTLSGAVPQAVGTTGSDGLTVRYLEDDGSVKTVRVEDFPR